MERLREVRFTPRGVNLYKLSERLEAPLEPSEHIPWTGGKRPKTRHELLQQIGVIAKLQELQGLGLLLVMKRRQALELGRCMGVSLYPLGWLRMDIWELAHMPPELALLAVTFWKEAGLKRDEKEIAKRLQRSQEKSFTAHYHMRKRDYI